MPEHFKVVCTLYTMQGAIQVLGFTFLRGLGHLLQIRQTRNQLINSQYMTCIIRDAGEVTVG